MSGDWRRAESVIVIRSHPVTEIIHNCDEVQFCRDDISVRITPTFIVVYYVRRDFPFQVYIIYVKYHKCTSYMSDTELENRTGLEHYKPPAGAVWRGGNALQ